jgi:hypothetical protein
LKLDIALYEHSIHEGELFQAYSLARDQCDLKQSKLFKQQLEAWKSQRPKTQQNTCLSLSELDKKLTDILVIITEKIKALIDIDDYDTAESLVESKEEFETWLKKHSLSSSNTTTTTIDTSTDTSTPTIPPKVLLLGRLQGSGIESSGQSIILNARYPIYNKTVKIKLSMNHSILTHEWQLLRRLSDKYPRYFIKVYDYVYGDRHEIGFAQLADATVQWY